jgi:hypothetical protein
VLTSVGMCVMGSYIFHKLKNRLTRSDSFSIEDMVEGGVIEKTTNTRGNLALSIRRRL